MNLSVTWLSIANSALSMINRQVLQSLDDAGTAAMLCNQFIPVVAKEVLAMNDWKCARKFISIAPLTSEPIPVGYSYAYQLPADFVRLHSLTGSWQRIGDRIYSDQPTLDMVYIAMPATPAAIDGMLVSAIIYLLASRLAYSLTSDYSLVSAYSQEGLTRIQLAKQHETAGEKDIMAEMNDLASEAVIL